MKNVCCVELDNTAKRESVFECNASTGQCVLSAGSAGHYTGITQALQRHYTVPGSAGQCRGHPAPAPRPAPTAHHRSWVTIQCFCLYTLSSNNQLNIIRGTVQCTVQCTVSSYKCRLRGTSNSVA